MIRHATEHDMPDILRMGAEFYAQTFYARFADFDEPSAETLARLLIAQGVLLVNDKDGRANGMIGLLLAPSMFNHGKAVAHEVMWWVDPEARKGGSGIRLKNEGEKAAKEMGAVAIQMLHMDDSPPQAGMIYLRSGYVPTEHSFMKEL